MTTPRIPGFELRIPSGTMIRDHEGQIVREISLTAIPVDRAPIPLPPTLQVPLLVTTQPGASRIYNNGAGARVIFPNTTGRRPGAGVNLYQYDSTRGWHIFGLGAVNADGTQIIPAPGVVVHHFSCRGFTGFFIGGPAPYAKGPALGNLSGSDGDPVDLGTGLFVHKKTDPFLSDVLPIALTRIYRNEDPQSRSFGIGATNLYEMFIWEADPTDSVEVYLILPDGGRLGYKQIASGPTYDDFAFEHTSSPSRFYKSKITHQAGWKLTLTDGTVYEFGNPHARLQGIRDRYGNRIAITRAGFFQNGPVAKVTSPGGRTIEFTYDASNRITQVQDNLGRIARYEYDAGGRLWKVTDPNGGVAEHTYDTAHRMLTIKDARGIVFLTNEYDATGRVIRQTQADNTTYLFAYMVDVNGRIIQTDVTDPRIFLRRVTFNSSGYTTLESRAVGQVEQQTTSYERELVTNLVLSVTDPLSRKTQYTYDPKGNVATVTRLAGTPEAVTTTLTYEPTFSQVASVTDPLGHTTAFAYDAKGNLTTVTDPLGNTTTLTSNAAGQPLTVTDPLGNTTQFAYEFGDLIAVTDPLGDTTRRVLDGAGRLVLLTNPLGHTMRYEYDTLNRLTKVTDPLGGGTAFTYDPNGNLLSVTDARGSVTSYTYNTMDRLATRTDPLLKGESSLYDQAGNLTQVTDRKGQATTFTSDALNRRTRATYADTSTTTSTYDKGNRLTQVVDSISGTVTRTYDNLDRLIQEATPQGTVSYTYDAAGRRTSLTLLGQPTIFYTYDAANRLTQLTQGTASVTFTYDAAGRRTSLTLPNGVVVTYTYDMTSRVTSITHKKGPTTLGTLTYAYDAAGNRTQVGGTWARTGLPQPVTSATYNANHQLTAWGGSTLSYDLNGNLISDGVNAYTWDARNRLAGMSGPGLSASFQYDPLVRRTRKSVNGTLTDFLYDGVNPVQELSGATVLANILTGLGIDEYFTRTDATGARTLLTDALGSTVALTDSTGTVQTQYSRIPHLGEEGSEIRRLDGGEIREAPSRRDRRLGSGRVFEVAGSRGKTSGHSGDTRCAPETAGHEPGGARFRGRARRARRWPRRARPDPPAAAPPEPTASGAAAPAA